MSGGRGLASRQTTQVPQSLVLGLGGFPGPSETPWVAPVTKTIGILSPLDYNANRIFGNGGEWGIISLLPTKC